MKFKIILSVFILFNLLCRFPSTAEEKEKVTDKKENSENKEIDSPQVKKASKKYNTELKFAEREFKKEVIRLKKKYIENLEKALNLALKKKDLELANKINDLKKKVEADAIYIPESMINEEKWENDLKNIKKIIMVKSSPNRFFLNLEEFEKKEFIREDAWDEVKKAIQIHPISRFTPAIMNFSNFTKKYKGKIYFNLRNHKKGDCRVVLKVDGESQKDLILSGNKWVKVVIPFNKQSVVLESHGGGKVRWYYENLFLVFKIIK